MPRAGRPVNRTPGDGMPFLSSRPRVCAGLFDENLASLTSAPFSRIPNSKTPRSARFFFFRGIEFFHSAVASPFPVTLAVAFDVAVHVGVGVVAAVVTALGEQLLSPLVSEARSSGRTRRLTDKHRGYAQEFRKRAESRAARWSASVRQA